MENKPKKASFMDDFKPKFSSITKKVQKNKKVFFIK
jgi:hypothetical protein